MKKLILDETRIRAKIRRMAYELWERLPTDAPVVMLGVDGPGAAVATALANELQHASGLDISVHTLRVNKQHPLKEAAELQTNLTRAAVVLVDDVAASGKTLLYALRPVLAQEPRQILLAVLVDRAHKAFPVSPDIVGHTVSTTLQEHIEVETDGERIVAAYLA